MLKIVLKFKFGRYFYVLIRLFIFVFILRNIHSIKESGKSYQSTTKRNLKSLMSLRDIYDGSRSDFYLNYLKKKEKLIDIKKSKVLIVGPRNEGEIYNFYANGFLIQNITAIDLVSYSNKIIASDANIYLKKCKKKFDYIYFGFVIGYFKNPKKIISLAAKCLNKNGCVVVCSEAARKINNLRRVEKTAKFHDLKSLSNIFPKNLKTLYKSKYTEKLYFFKSEFIKCFLIIKKNS